LKGSRLSMNSGTSFSSSRMLLASATPAFRYAFVRAKTIHFPSGLQVGLLWTYSGSSAPGSGA
jgi:hypothetical protein